MLTPLDLDRKTTAMLKISDEMELKKASQESLFWSASQAALQSLNPFTAEGSHVSIASNGSLMIPVSKELTLKKEEKKK